MVLSLCWFANSTVWVKLCKATNPENNLLSLRFELLGKGTIYFDDFIQVCIVLHNLTAAFKQFDTDFDGVITIHYEQFLQMVLNTRV